MRRTIPVEKKKHLWVAEGTSMRKIQQTNDTGHRTVCFFHLEMNTGAVKMLRYYGQLNIHMSLYIWVI